LKFSCVLTTGKIVINEGYFIMDADCSPCTFEAFTDVASSKKMNKDANKYDKHTQYNSVSQYFKRAYDFHFIQ